VSGLPSEFGPRVKVELIDSTAPGAAEAIRLLGFQGHGLVIHQGDRVLFQAADHGVRMEEVRAALTQALGGRLNERRSPAG
jgi:hypothetical protein